MTYLESIDLVLIRGFYGQVIIWKQLITREIKIESVVLLMYLIMNQLIRDKISCSFKI